MRVSDVKIGQRHRKDMGDIAAMAESIKRTGGLLHPIVVNGDGLLIVGERRLEAYKLLGWTDIPHRTVTTLDEAHAALIAERDENTERKQFTPSEAVALAEALKPFEKAEATARLKETQPKRGERVGAVKLTTPTKPDKNGQSANGKAVPPPTETGAYLDAVLGPTAAPARAADKVAEAVGMSRNTLAKATAVVEAAATDPEHFGDLPAQMDATGKVDPVHQELARRAVEHPLPGGKTPKQQAKESPALKWSQLVTRLWQFANSVKSGGGVAKLAARWSDAQRGDFAKQLRKLRHEINAILNELDGSPIDATEGNGRAR